MRKSLLYLFACGVAAAQFISPAAAQSEVDASRASVAASIGLPVAATGASAQFFRDAGQLSVAGVRASGRVTTIVLKSTQSGAEFSVQVASKGMEGSALAVGVTITTVVSATGHMLMHAGKALIFVPNEIGQSLLHHSRSRDY